MPPTSAFRDLLTTTLEPRVPPGGTTVEVRSFADDHGLTIGPRVRCGVRGSSGQDLARTRSRVAIACQSRWGRGRVRPVEACSVAAWVPGPAPIWATCRQVRGVGRRRRWSLSWPAISQWASSASRCADVPPGEPGPWTRGLRAVGRSIGQVHAAGVAHRFRMCFCPHQSLLEFFLERSKLPHALPDRSTVLAKALPHALTRLPSGNARH